MEAQIQEFQFAIAALKEQRNEALDRVADYSAALNKANNVISGLSKRISELEENKENKDE